MFTVVRDTFTVWMEENMKDPVSGSALSVKTFMTPQQLLGLNALNIRFLSEVSSVENSVWDILVSLDIIVGDAKPQVANETIKPERIAVDRWQKAVYNALKHGTTQEQIVGNVVTKKGVFIRTASSETRGVWHPELGYLTWQNLEGMSFKDVPSESYIHKNMTLMVTCIYEGN